jgi:nucleotide-binding universal stress UspA family protein
MIRRIVAVVEGKATDQRVVDQVGDLARQMRAQVTLLRVVAVAHDEGGGLGLQFQLEIGSSGWRRMQQANRFLPVYAQQLAQLGCVVETEVLIGSRSEADEIVGYAARNGLDLIVLAADPRPWYRRILGSSPVHGVLRNATVPVLTIDAGSRSTPAKRAVPQAPKIMNVLGSADI